MCGLSVHKATQCSYNVDNVSLQCSCGSLIFGGSQQFMQFEAGNVEIHFGCYIMQAFDKQAFVCLYNTTEVIVVNLLDMPSQWPIGSTVILTQYPIAL